MSNVSSRAVRGKHPYQNIYQKELDACSNSVNPITVVWETSVIKRDKVTGRVRLYRHGVLIYDSAKS